MTATAKKPTRIQKAGNGHSYYLDGEKVPGVTTLLGEGFPKPALQNWAAKATAEFVIEALEERDGHISADRLLAELRTLNTESRYPKRWDGKFSRSMMTEVLTGVRYRSRDAAANRGSEVHDMAERLARGEKVTPPDEIAGHVAAYVRFLNEWQPTNALVERVVIHRRFRYMGKFDLFAEFPGKVWASGPWAGRPVGPALLDVKTSGSGIFPDVGLQLAGYAGAETMLDGDEEVPMPKAEWVGAIHVRADGYDVIPFLVRPGDEKDPTYRAFIYAATVARWRERQGDFKSSSCIRMDSQKPPVPA